MIFKTDWLEKLKNAVAGTRARLAPTALDSEAADAPFNWQDALEQLETGLLRADVGLETTEMLLNQLQQVSPKPNSHKAFRDATKHALQSCLLPSAPLKATPDGLSVMMLVGVNGSGKTTSLGKLACRYQQSGLSVVLGAGDTYRAAAIEQLSVWAERAQCKFIQKSAGSDPSAVAFETVKTALDSHAHVALIDTAGRLQNKTNLMQELAKTRKAIDKALGPLANQTPVECLLVLDAVTGQNALQQAEGFLAATGLTGVVLTKLDGSAKGGIVFALAAQHKLAVRLVSVGEQPEDLAEFDSALFVEALLP
ncbi:MAG: signal recognition particle-docking protein FtsY [Vampirovibrionales bacterium]|nr:signal recognition particle-docking protein FtsY [Vampirovibrionales bacterium]